MTELSPLMVRRVHALEAALYSAGRPLSIEEALPVLGTKSDRVAAKVVHLISHKYRIRDCALEVVIMDDGRIVMQLKPSYEEMVQKFNKKKGEFFGFRQGSVSHSVIPNAGRA